MATYFIHLRRLSASPRQVSATLLYRRFSSRPLLCTGKPPVLWEEETLPEYDPSLFYPVHIDEVWKGRYHVRAKLGYGGSSTVWLCNDRRDASYKVIKVLANGLGGEQELSILESLNASSTDHVGQYCIRKACDTSTLERVTGAVDCSHQWLVYEPLGINMLEYFDRQQQHKTLGIMRAKFFAVYLSNGLDYLHQCGIVHTDIKLNNMQFLLPDGQEEAILSKSVRSETEQPGPRKVVDHDRTISTSRPMEYEEPFTYPILCDLGTSVLVEQKHSGKIQTLPYRAPEVISGIEWSSSADIWNFGVLLWQLLLGTHLFGNHCESDSLARMVKHLDQPPDASSERCNSASTYLGADGPSKLPSLRHIALQDLIDENDRDSVFIDFISSTLNWLPEERRTAAELLEHPWLEVDT